MKHGSLTLEESKKLINKVKKGIATRQDEWKLMQEIEFRYIPHKHENYLYDPEELRSEFLMAAWNAVFRAKPDVGDPIAFCIHRGNKAMIDYYRKVNSQKLIKYCPICGTEYTYDSRNKVCKNSECQPVDLLSKEKEYANTDSMELQNLSVVDHVQEKLEAEEMLVAIISYIQNMETMGDTFKDLATDAINNRMDFYDRARMSGKSHSWSINFKKQVIDLLKANKDKFEFAI